MGCAVRAVIAIYIFATVALVRVGIKLALGDLEVLFWDDLVQRVGSSRKCLASIAVTCLSSASGPGKLEYLIKFTKGYGLCPRA